MSETKTEIFISDLAERISWGLFTDFTEEEVKAVIVESNGSWAVIRAGCSTSEVFVKMIDSARDLDAILEQYPSVAALIYQIDLTNCEFDKKVKLAYTFKGDRNSMILSYEKNADHFVMINIEMPL